MMIKTALKISLQAAAVVLFSAIVAVTTNALRDDGIPLVTDVEYEIFAPCKDSEADSAAASTNDMTGSEAGNVMYVDARPVEAFALEHVETAVNVPYSVLFGAADADLASLKESIASKKPKTVIVYGVFADPADPSSKVDFAKPLALQLIDSGVAGVKHLEGGMEELKKNGARTVQGTGGSK